MRRGSPVVVVAVFAVLAACTSGRDGDRPAHVNRDAAAVEIGQAIDRDRSGPAAPIDGAVAGGTVTVLSDAISTETLDPTQAYNPDVRSILSGLVTRSLTQYVFDPVQQTMVLVPDIATDTGRPNANFTEWSFTIRDGVRYENGTEVNADDVAFGIKRSFDRRTFDEGPGYSNAYFLDGDTYKGPYRTGSVYRGVRVDGNTVTIRMAQPFPDMPYWAAFPAMGPIPEQRSNPTTYWRHPLATGPYQIASYTPDRSVTLVRNDQWHPDTDPGRHAYPDRYVFDFTAKPERSASTILGDSDWGQTTLAYASPVSSDTLSAAVYARARRLHRLTVGPGPCTGWWAPDYRKITDVRVREAIGYAFPYKKAVLAFGNIPGVTWRPATSILPPNFPGRQTFNPLTTQPGHTDPDKARALLKQAGYPPGEYTLKWAYDTSDPSSAAGNQVVIAALEAAGFSTKPYPLPSPEAVYEMTSDSKAPLNLRPGGWCPDWPSGSLWFNDPFHSLGVGSFFAEPAVDAQIERISRRPLDEQPAQWGALDKTIMTDYYPVVITGHQVGPLLHGARIGGMSVDSNLAMPTWKDIHVIP